MFVCMYVCMYTCMYVYLRVCLSFCLVVCVFRFPMARPRAPTAAARTARYLICVRITTENESLLESQNHQLLDSETQSISDRFFLFLITTSIDLCVYQGLVFTLSIQLRNGLGSRVVPHNQHVVCANPVMLNIAC